ncbi:hypothetical protein D3C76_1251220 [compost metagenome]
MILAHRRLCIAEGHVLVRHVADHCHNGLRLHSHRTQRLGRVVGCLLFLTQSHTVIHHQQRLFLQGSVGHIKLDAVLPQAGFDHRLRRPGLRGHPVLIKGIALRGRLLLKLVLQRRLPYLFDMTAGHFLRAQPAAVLLGTGLETDSETGNYQQIATVHAPCSMGKSRQRRQRAQAPQGS